MYKAIIRFADSKDKNYIYEIGDVYPREGYKPSQERVADLLSANNGAHKIVIEELPEKETELPEEEPAEKPKKSK